MEQRIALIAGASGLVGTLLLKELLVNENYQRVIALVRRPRGMDHEKLEEVVVDFDHAESYASWFNGVDDVFCCLGTTIYKAGSQEAFRKVDYTYPLSLAKLSAVSGVRRFLCITALGANAGSRFFYNRVKGELEAAVSALPIPVIMFFRPSLLLGDRQEKRTGERIAMMIAKTFGFIFRGPLLRYKGIEAYRVAHGMVHFALHEIPGITVIDSEKLQLL